MKALQFDNEKGLLLIERNRPELKRTRDVLIKIEATGICGTDIHILKKDYPARQGVILGHESSGTVVETGTEVKGFMPGDRVILDPTFRCGVCYYCQTNRPNYCLEKSHTETGVSADGTFCGYHVAEARFFHHMPENLSFETATLAEPLGCVLQAFRQTRFQPGYRTLIVGAGPIGLLFALAVTISGGIVTIGDIDEYRVRAAGKFVQNVQDYSSAGISETNNGRKFDLVIDTSGRVLEELLEICDKGGDILTVGLDYNFKATISPSFLTDNGIRIIGSIDTNLTMRPAIDMLSTYPEFGSIISHRYNIQDYREAFAILGLDLATGKRTGIRAEKVIINP
ncbi:MAG: alcohol dehydrogenase catalytic domain-containing protein [Spirochaetales bacterium]|nr:alcohol dehydrogenase catalytic domain-containing protein [Spirochaetales bacterium]